MNHFDQIIGYDDIKQELMQICDMFRHTETYHKLGAKMPNGLLLHGAPGLGKTLMARCFIDESGIKSYTIRRSKGSDDFIAEITDTFRQAKENAPAIVFLDDMDKFANEDRSHRDAPEYVAIQAAIDEVRGAGVFVLATANDIFKLPHSLIRTGRFDRKIEVESPGISDGSKIIRHYLRDKNLAPDVNMKDLTMMICYNSCAELETIINEATLRAASLRHNAICMDDLVQTVLAIQFEKPGDFSLISERELQEVSLHEAGHVVACEVLNPGFIGLAALHVEDEDCLWGIARKNGFLKQRDADILVSLAGKAALDLYYSDLRDTGYTEDLQRAASLIWEQIFEEADRGFGLMDLSHKTSYDPTQRSMEAMEAVIRAELERYMQKTRGILLRNRGFLERTAKMLAEKKILLHSDIRLLREQAGLTGAAV